ncbi:hypothetical protein PpBr36_01232 [Pyricularia pennisetigena]|uniref:hypothetical protein n=1 Tax=Pyricularia pennisetigena TaxID=1578925 RepID=UPI00115438AE|nr:hypothetical protein PpBr36_01232 [Pyricularia pennisetigena]TLS28847.1 hypothetical protein PpBr36_01232 [Pyricularia pennisetigena]
MTISVQQEEVSAAALAMNQSTATPSSPRNQRLHDPDASIILVGCRGAGKRSLGFIAALHLRRRLVTEDHCFEQITGVSRATYLRQHGKDAFARQNAEVFKRMLDVNRNGCIIVCGMTSLSEEAQHILEQYCRSNPVVYVHREKDHMKKFLDHSDAMQILAADQIHRRCSNMEYFNLFDPSSTKYASINDTQSPRWDALSASSSTLVNAKEDFTTFLDLMQGQGWRRKFLESPFSIHALPPEFRQYSYALRLRLSWLLEMSVSWEDLEAAGDCVELIVDCWPDDLPNVIAKQVALIRRNLGCPLIFHVEENPRNQRRRSQEEKDAIDADLLELGLRLNADYVSLDLQRNPAVIGRVLERRGRTRIIGNFWYLGMGALAWADPSQLENFIHAKSLGCDVVRMIRFCSGDNPVERLLELKEKIQTTVPDPKPPLVAYDFSVLGARTPLQSNILIPVKHSGMDNTDHLATVCTYENSFNRLFTQLMLDPLQFYVLGASVSYSISPAMHQAAYDFSRIPHTFQAVSCSTLGELYRICYDSSFGGASLAAPFKVAIMPQLKLKSHHASIIGAVNVLLPLRGQTGSILSHATSRNKAGPVNNFYGDNTDWSSILTCLKRSISPRNYVRPSKTTALVVGAGGMARAAIYALIQLGCRNIFIHNRTQRNASEVAEHFNNLVREKKIATTPSQPQICHVLPSRSQEWPDVYEMPTIIISCVPAISPDDGLPVNFTLPEQWLSSPTGGVVVELAYEPLVTPLISQIRAYQQSISPYWVLVDGLGVVSEMAIEAFELMTDLGQSPQQIIGMPISLPQCTRKSIKDTETCSSETTSPQFEDELIADDEYILCTGEGDLPRRPIFRSRRVFVEIPESEYGDDYTIRDDEDVKVLKPTRENNSLYPYRVRTAAASKGPKGSATRFLNHSRPPPRGYKALRKVRPESRHVWFSGDGFTQSEARPMGRSIGSKRKASDSTSATGILDLGALSLHTNLDQDEPTAKEEASKRIRFEHVIGGGHDWNSTSMQHDHRKFGRKSDANAGEGLVPPSNDSSRVKGGPSERLSVASQTPQVARLARSSSLPVVLMTPRNFPAAILKGRFFCLVGNCLS